MCAIKERFFAKVDKTGECWFWKGGKSTGGYGRFWHGGRTVQAHRLALEWAVGPPPDGKTEAAHICRNKNCVNPAHSSWSSHAENMQDRIRDGTAPRGKRNGRAKLSEAQVLEIRTLYAAGDVLQRELGKRFGVTGQLIGYIVRGEIWAHVNGEAS